MKKSGTGLKIWQSLEPAPELVEIQDLMPIDQGDYERLKKDIQKNGVRDPLKIYQKGTRHFIIGGLNRWKIAQELGISDPLPVDIYQGTGKQYRELAIIDNLNRRHLTAEQKRDLIKYFLKKDPEQSNKSIARKTGTTKETVKTQREKLTTGGEIRPVKMVKGQDGKLYKKQQKQAESSTNVHFNAPQTHQEAPGEAPEDLGGVAVGVSFSGAEIAVLERLIVQAIKGEYETPATRKALESIRRKLSEARRGV